MSNVWVVAFEPIDNRTSVAGFDWYYGESIASSAFNREVFDLGRTHEIRLIRFPLFNQVDSYKEDEITAIINDAVVSGSKMDVLVKHIPD